MTGMLLPLLDSVFSPSQIPGLKLWCDAAKLTGFADADPVGTWPDLSGNGNDLAQGSAALKPAYRVTGINGRPGVEFDGVNDVLIGPTFGAALAQPNTIVVVASVSSGAGSGIYFTDGKSAGNRQAIGRTLNTANKLGIFANAVLEETGTHAGAIAPSIYAGVFNGASSEFRLNGASMATGDAGAHAMDGLTLGARFSSTSWIAGTFGAVLVFNSLVSATDIRRLERYLGKRYGVAVS